MPGLMLGGQSAEIDGAIPGVSGDPAPSSSRSALTIQVTKPIGLQPIGQNAKQKMTWQLSGGAAAEYRVPTGPKTAEVEIAQVRDLDVSSLPSGRAGPILTRGMNAQDVTVDGRAPILPPPAARNSVNPAAIDLLRIEFQLQAFANHAGKKATHRMLLPTGGPSSSRSLPPSVTQHRDDASLF